MSEIFNALPGIEVPVGDISAGLARLWADEATRGHAAPASEDGKAIQVNFVIHFGFGCTPADALAQFRTAVTFSSRYPSRVVVLCPRRDSNLKDVQTRAKIYGECFLGKTKGDTRCCEFVILNYSFAARLYLENQVSVCLSNDLPTYYWAHQFTSCQRMSDYHQLITRARRFIFDSAAAPEDAITHPWANPQVRDLAYARILPVRQLIGQFLSRYSPEALAQSLRTVTASFEQVHAAEGRALLRWTRERLLGCGVKEASVQWSETELPHGEGTCFALDFTYADGRRFRWFGNCDTGVAHFSADLGTGQTELPSHIRLLPPELALAEAIFF